MRPKGKRKKFKFKVSVEDITRGEQQVRQEKCNKSCKYDPLTPHYEKCIRACVRCEEAKEKESKYWYFTIECEEVGK